MQNLFKDLEILLHQKPELKLFSADGKLLRNLVIEMGLKLDPELLDLLLSHNRIKQHFFTQVGDVLVFDKEKFLQFVNNKEFLPDSFTKFKINIGLSDDEGRTLISSKNQVSLFWPYKDCVLEGGQQKENNKREEIFWSTTLAPDDISRLFEPKVHTNWKRFTATDSDNLIKLTENENYIIKGNNLLVLHSILAKFRGKIKLIYADPPYNTGGSADTFNYNNNFDHSTWLTFMKNRLEVAKDLLREDGFIAITIDHVELFYLGALADEIFGRENRVGIVTIVHNPKGRNLAKFFSPNSEFMLVYAKNINEAEFEQVAIDEEKINTFDQQDDEGRFRWEPFLRSRTVWSRSVRPKNWYPIYVSENLDHITHEKTEGYHAVYPITNDGKEMAWKNIKETFKQLNEGDYFQAREIEGRIEIYHKYREQQVFKNVWTDQKYQSEFHGTNLLKDLLGKNVFSYPKSLYAVMDTIKIMTSDDEIILDFFAGSGTTAHAVLKLNDEDGGNRKFILCEQLDYIHDITIKRVQKVLEDIDNNSFIYFELLKWNEYFVERIIDGQNRDDLFKIWEQIKSQAFLSYKVDIKKFDEHAEEFKDLSLEDQKKFLLEVLDKNSLYVNFSEIDDVEYGVTDEDKRLNRQFYGVEA